MQKKQKIAAANKEYDNYALHQCYSNLWGGGTKGYKSVPFFKKLGNAYYFNAQLEQK
jgi:hypothetical protein